MIATYLPIVIYMVYECLWSNATLCGEITTQYSNLQFAESTDDKHDIDFKQNCSTQDDGASRRRQQEVFK